MHITKRGARGMEIVRDDSDRFNFVRSAFITNDVHQSNDWRALSVNKPLFYRPESWPDHRPLVSILAWVLLDNHFHMLVQEVEEGGIAKFMQRFSNSLSRYFNEKYNGRGSIFQGSYKGRLVDTDEYLQYVHAYIVAKNTFEMCPGGLKRALTDFEYAWENAKQYKFSSLLTATDGLESPLLDIPAIQSLGLVRKDFKQYVRSMITHHAKTKARYTNVDLLENW